MEIVAIHMGFLMVLRFCLLFTWVLNSFYGNRCYLHWFFDGFAFLFVIYMVLSSFHGHRFYLCGFFGFFDVVA